jgi:hypothetical protein
LIVLPDAPLKDTVPVPALNTPLLVQLPFTSRLKEPIAVSVPLIVIFWHVPALLVIVTVVPLAMTTSSFGPGTFPQLQVETLFHAPELIDVHVANPDSNFELLFF